MKGKRLLGSTLAAVLVLVLMAGFSQAQQPASTPLGTGFTYQGQLKSDDTPYTGTCDFKFGLWDALTNGTQIGTTQTRINVSLSEGYFTVSLDYGTGAFQGDGRWLDISVRCPSGIGTYTPLTPRQALTASPYALYAAGAWQTTGNSGTVPPTSYLGTSDNQALVLKVNGSRALRLEPNDNSPNVIGGYKTNSVTDGAYGATIGGGGYSLNPNRVTDFFGTVAGGSANVAGDNDGDTSDVDSATVGGGYSNVASASGSTIAGGWLNSASGSYATVGGGTGNSASWSYDAVGGGAGNSASAYYSTIAGGNSNTAHGVAATVGGGQNNYAGGLDATVAGGESNAVNGFMAAVGGGLSNDASGQSATIPGGETNTASGHVSFAAGHHAQATHDGAFVWADSQDEYFVDAGPNTFNVRASGGAVVVAENLYYGLKVSNTYSTAGDAIDAYSNASLGGLNAAVHAYNHGDSPGLFADSDGTYAGVFQGDISVGGCDGCLLIQFGLNDGAAALQPGDLAAISGLAEPLAGSKQPILSVHRAVAGEAVVGVVQARGTRSQSTRDGKTVEFIDRTEGDVQPSDYLFLVVYGPAQVKADAASGPIAVGTRLTAGQAGSARALQTRTVEGMVVAEAAPGVGIALEALHTGTALISVFVTLN